MENERELDFNDVDDSDDSDQMSIDWNVVTIPDEVVAKHPAYRKVLRETMERKRALRELQTPAPSNNPEPPEWAQTLLSKVASIEAQSVRNRVKSDLGLTDEQISLIPGSSEQEIRETAEKLMSIFGTKPAQQMPITPQPFSPQEMLKRITERNNGDRY